MAKSKKKKKPVRKTFQKKNKLKFNYRKINILLAVLAVILLGIYFLFLGNKHEAMIKSLPKNEKIALVLRPKASPTGTKSAMLISPYPSDYPNTVKATPAPLTGYCLRVPVLMYHHIQPEAAATQLGQTSLTVDNGVFAQQMAYLANNGYNAIWASDLVNALITHSPLPPRSILITMDDGYKDNDTYALPVLEQYHLKANLMLASGLVDSNPDMLTWSEVSDLKNSGLFYFTNHTWSHWPISRGPQSKIDFEIDTAQSEIQQHTGQTINIFTYPYGSFNSNAIQTLVSRGYIGGFSTISGQYQCDSFIMTLHRTRIGNAPLSAYGI